MSNDLDGVLAVEDIVDAISPAYLYRVDLVQVEVCNCTRDVCLG